jgi:hypothetical protein
MEQEKISKNLKKNLFPTELYDSVYDNEDVNIIYHMFDLNICDSIRGALQVCIYV